MAWFSRLLIATMDSDIISPESGKEPLIQEPEPTQAFTVRFGRAVHRRLKTVAELEHVAMNDIVVGAVEHELARRSEDLRAKLENALARLDSFELTDEEFERHVERFAEGEALGDPLQATYVGDLEDAYGVSEIFADTMEH